MSYNRPNTIIRPLIGLMCLLAYLGVATHLIPALAALTAWVDGEHQVSMAVEGQTSRVILSHDSKDPIKSLSHAHCAVSRGLASLGEPPNPFHPDHVLQFASAEIAAPRSILLQALAAEIPTLPQTAFSLHSSLVDIAPRSFTPAIPSEHTPALSVAFARVTVLLI